MVGVVVLILLLKRWISQWQNISLSSFIQIAAKELFQHKVKPLFALGRKGYIYYILQRKQAPSLTSNWLKVPAFIADTCWEKKNLAAKSPDSSSETLHFLPYLSIQFRQATEWNLHSWAIP